MSSRSISLIVALALTLLAGCGRPTVKPDAEPVSRAEAEVTPLTAENFASKTRAEIEQPAPGSSGIDLTGDDPSKLEAPKPEIQVGTGRFIDEAAARRTPVVPGGEGQVDFNFENNPIQAVVKAILGDLLQQNYTIAPNVGGNVSFSTSKPIRADQAMSVLEMLLSWTGNTLIYKDGRYTVLQIKDALPGNLTPRIAAPKLALGYEVRVFPLRYVSPSEMAKLLKPYAKPEAFVNIDTARSMLVLAGTASELVNYAQTIDIFDVDWLKGMSIGVFTLQRAEVATLLPELEKVFGAAGESPLAGMFRFLPIERSNAIIAITAQPEYLRQAEEWLRRLDRAGEESSTQLYVYDVKNIKSLDLADYLNDIFLGSGGGSSSRRSSTSGSVAPGLTPVTVGGGGIGRAGSSRLSNRRASSVTTAAASAPAAAGATPAAGGGGIAGQDSGLRITAVEESNQLLVLASPLEWDAMQSAIRRLDIAPLQVHIETKILEVTLTGKLQYGVQWWFAGLRGSAPYNGVEYNVLNRSDRQRSGLGAAGPGEDGSIFWSYLNSKFQVAISALETSGQAKVLSAPSLVVINNQEAQINVGTQIPIQQQTFLTGSFGVQNNGGNNNSLAGSGIGTVQYIDTGVILQVKPRVNPGGLVYLEVSQEVSSQGATAPNSQNPAINKRTLDTQIAVQSGETVLLGGLIGDSAIGNETGVPGLSRIPLLGKLFGQTTNDTVRTELIVMITPRVMENTEQAREVTEDYRRQFQSLAPLPAETAREPRRSPPTD